MKNWPLSHNTKKEIWFVAAWWKNMQSFWMNNCWETLKNITFQYSNNCSSFYYYFVSFSCLRKHPNSFFLSLLFKTKTPRIMLISVTQRVPFHCGINKFKQTPENVCISVFSKRFLSVPGMQNEQKILLIMWKHEDRLGSVLLNIRLIYPHCVLHCATCNHTCELSVPQHRNFCISKYFHHNQEDFVYLVLCFHGAPLDHHNCLNPCKLNNHIHYFQHEVGNFWEEYQD